MQLTTVELIGIILGAMSAGGALGMFIMAALTVGSDRNAEGSGEDER